MIRDQSISGSARAEHIVCGKRNDLAFEHIQRYNLAYNTSRSEYFCPNRDPIGITLAEIESISWKF